MIGPHVLPDILDFPESGGTNPAHQLRPTEPSDIIIRMLGAHMDLHVTHFRETPLADVAHETRWLLTLVTHMSGEKSAILEPHRTGIARKRPTKT